MPSEAAIEEAFKQAVDRALCRVSCEPFEDLMEDRSASAACRINRAMSELKKLTEGCEQPDYANPDVALFYTQWYLPQQINVAYSEGARILQQPERSRQNELQLVDYGAGTGAMVIGLSLAIAVQPEEHWPDLIAVYPIDGRTMLGLGHKVWSSILDEVSRQQELEGLAEVLDRALFECPPAAEGTGLKNIEPWQDSERWLTAIHVAYSGSMRAVCRDLQSLRERMLPTVSLRTVPSFKKRLWKIHCPPTEEPKPVELRLEGVAERMTDRRRRFLKELLQGLGDGRGAALGQQPEDLLHYLNGHIRWKDERQGKEPLAEMVWKGEVEQHG